MAIQDWRDAPEIHPSQIRVGDIIGTVEPDHARYTVKLISGPQTTPRRWTFFGSDNAGRSAAVLRSFIASCKRRGPSQRTFRAKRPERACKLEVRPW